MATEVGMSIVGPLLKSLLLIKYFMRPDEIIFDVLARDAFVLLTQ